MNGKKSHSVCIYMHNVAICNSLGVFGGYYEGNGTPLQYFCLENPMDGGAW